MTEFRPSEYFLLFLFEQTEFIVLAELGLANGTWFVSIVWIVENWGWMEFIWLIFRGLEIVVGETEIGIEVKGAFKVTIRVGASSERSDTFKELWNH